MKRLLLVTSWVLSPFLLSCQPNFSTLKVTSYSIEGADYEEYVVTVEVDNESFAWIAEESVKAISTDNLVRAFFFKRRKDLTLNDFITNNLLSTKNIVVGKRWFIKLQPSNTLSISFVSSKEDIPDLIEEWQSDNLQIIEQNNWNSYLRNLDVTTIPNMIESCIIVC